jgi:glutamate N-acetyltransferase/amino-acid N-acetyltransferase
MADARESVALVAQALGCETHDVLVCSTGVIGVNLPMPKIRAAIPVAAAGLSAQGGAAAARAIMTTDTKPKESSRTFDLGGVPVTIGGMAKGAGMIAPSLAPLHATMLAFFTTDATGRSRDCSMRRSWPPWVRRSTASPSTPTRPPTTPPSSSPTAPSGAAPITSTGALRTTRCVDAFRAVCRDLASDDGPRRRGRAAHRRSGREGRAHRLRTRCASPAPSPTRPW